ncbi:MAG: OmpA family protein, partial [Dokdonia donghaensis]|nr:OmpA family protein [Dokdonia donghaensis]
INAHTDAQGSASYNKRLSMRRAASAMNYLLSKGISKDRLQSQGFGEEQLLINCTLCTPQENELNRRIEFVVISNE